MFGIGINILYFISAKESLKSQYDDLHDEGLRVLSL